MSARPSVSVVVTNFDGEHYLDEMMAALRRTGYPFKEVIVSDDCPNDGSRLLLRHRYPDVILVTSDRNRGPCPARNAGIARATSELVLLLDNDAFPFPDAVEPMVRAFEERPELAGVMPRVIVRGDPPVVQCDGARTHVTGQMWLVNGHRPLETPPVPEEIASLMGTAMMFRRDAALRIGGFEPAYFIYYEDHDFGTRLRLLEGPLVSVPTARIDHSSGTAGLSFRVGGHYPRRRAYLMAKNRWSFALRCLSGRTMTVLFPIFVLHEFAQFAFTLSRGWLETWVAALAWNVGHLGRTLRAREFIQTRRRTPDRAILQDGALPLHPGIMAKRGAAACVRAILERTIDALYRPLRRML